VAPFQKRSDSSLYFWPRNPYFYSIAAVTWQRRQSQGAQHRVQLRARNFGREFDWLPHLTRTGRGLRLCLHFSADASHDNGNIIMPCRIGGQGSQVPGRI